jgi:serine/threonine protein kinase
MTAVATRSPVTREAPPLIDESEVAPGYRLIAHLSRGRSLDAYDAWSEERQCRCVVKVPRPERLEDPRTRRRLRAEGRLACALNHPHLVRGYELVVRPHPVLALETLDGETLEHLIGTRRQRLSAYELAHLGLHLCSALHYLHRQGFIHLDLKPSNIVSECGRAKVIDLSLARRPGRGRRGVGTRRYMAPEQARGGRVDEATDVWGIGVVLFEAAASRHPFETPNGTRYPQLDRRAPALRTLRRLPAGFAEAIDASLEPDREARPTVAELASLLGDFA